LSKKFSVDPLEKWAVLVARDMMARHSHISAVTVNVDKLPWDRVVIDGKEHNHVFTRGAGGVRFVTMRLTRGGDLQLTSGIKELQIMKTTQSGFTDFIKDEYTTLPEFRDRILCTKICAAWKFDNPDMERTAFTDIYDDVRRTTLSIFAGPPETGVYSPSVQETIYQIGQAVLKRYAAIASIKFVLPNIHFFLVNFKDFKTTVTNNGEVFHTHAGAHGQIEGTVERTPRSRM